LTYGRAKGLFAGMSLNGASLKPDSSADQRLYGKAVSAGEIVLDNAVKATPAGPVTGSGSREARIKIRYIRKSIRPEAYIAESDYGLSTLVTVDKGLFAAVCKGLAASSR